jgi:hypothetical protein
MKVEGPGKTSGPRAASKAGAKKTGDGAFSSLIGESETAEPASAVTGPSAIARLDALLALQEAGDGASGPARRAKKRGEALLDQLDQVRVGLLSGGIPRTALQQMAQMVNARRESVMDPVLAALLDDIDLRVQVELAKHGG